MFNSEELALFLPKITLSKVMDGPLYNEIAEPHVALFPVKLQLTISVWNVYPLLERIQSPPPCEGATLSSNEQFIIDALSLLL